MTTALYRRYRPESFGEMIGQSQVTDPLMTALRGDRVGHAYLFSGPRGCGKTTSARILARCLNCAEGPTDVPCGTCPSCVELSRAGGGSLDVVEIDAASHNGVDDARDLRERATFAPSRDRYKIFILDEAHMVTPQGFNALLKLVEEPPEHVKFIFATTEPEKVLGTIRSRTHHYPFRLVPPAAMLEYVEKLCKEEGVAVEQGVLPLVVRAGGGSPRDTLSLLDQLIAGSDSPAGSEIVEVKYERAVSLLGYTHATVLDEIVDALAAGDAAAAFPAIDKVVQTGQDPRRFVDDLLERLRDLIVIAAVGAGAAAVLRGVADDELERWRGQAAVFGSARLSRTADIVSAALDDMSGATSPRLHLELLVARVLAGGADAGTSAPVASAPAASAPVTSAPAASAPVTSAPAAATAEPVASPVAPRGSAATETKRVDPAATSAPAVTSAPASTSAPVAAASAPASSAPAAPSGPVTLERIAGSWSAVLKRLEDISRTSWLLATAVQPLAYDTESEVLTLGFTSQHDVQKFKGSVPGSGPSDHLRTAIEQELGVTVKYRPAPMPAGGAPRQPSSSAPSTGDAPSASEPASARSSRPQSRSESSAPVTEWAVASIPAASSDAAAPATLGSGAPTAPTAEAAAAAAASIASGPVAAAATASVVPPASVAGTSSDAPVQMPQPSVGTAETPRRDSSSAPAPAAVDEPPYDDEPPYYDDEPPYDPAYEPASVGAPVARPTAPASPAPAHTAPASSAPASAPSPSPVRPQSAPVVTERAPGGGVQRYGEAVIRQVLGATFVREEPYEPPTRFN
ncbi:DNA polymerase III subunit tau [Microbacterium hydrocarbonoxydans]|uniref:DNA-directed DNA polymerase n=1 Tax=Microbacterium hydrocarbonoxydans TaxID=273678 RepID=A0A0M2HRQ9_9MICO|nr:DNA polymerase III subunit gamma and tau [Microbacterium hydrocarbonoxydans]KJL49371.1 DNA polymerase III subunit tau [Microbacterium hydrocarbonoxydans]